MKLNGINGIYSQKTELNTSQTKVQSNQFKPILSFAPTGNADGAIDDPLEGKIITERFKNEVMKKLGNSSGNNKYYLDKLIDRAQKLNGIQKNNLKPNGTPEQNNLYDKRIKEAISVMNSSAKAIGLSIEQDDKTGLYKLNIEGTLYDIPERKVEIGTRETADGVELEPQIVD